MSMTNTSTTANEKNYQSQGCTVSDVERFGVDGKKIETVKMTTQRLGDNVYVSVDNGTRIQNYIMPVSAFAYLAKVLD